MEPKHFLGKVSVRAIIVHEGKVLIIRDVRDPEVWEIPGGRLDEGEEVEGTLRREIKEELGVDVIVTSLIHTEQYNQVHDGSLHLLLAYEAKLKDPDAAFVLAPDEVAEYKWIDRDSLASEKLYDNCRNALQAYWSG